MKIDLNELKSYPNIMSKEQLCKACHISKRTALFLLENGLIPHIDTGKRTRCYIIRKADVIAFARKQNSESFRKEQPQQPAAPEPVQEVISSVRIKTQMPKDSEVIRRFYKSKMSAYPDVMSTAQVTEFTGYNRHTVGRWISTEKLRPLRVGHKHMIPKVYLLDFMMSDGFSKIVRKTSEHKMLLWELVKKKGDKSCPQKGGRE